MRAQKSVYSVSQYPLSKLTEKIIGCAIVVHKELGPGFVEKIYQGALAKEFSKNKVVYEKEKKVVVNYDNKAVGYQIMDFIVDDKVVVELKAVSELSNIHIGQMVSYLKAIRLEIGLILNFAKSKIEIKRVKL
ncbi:MAG: GxxExxY protein [Candidatus Omnitrophica bacterium]|nr:GxxExxY protein [Candidatus Omnitrophota bacterium]